MVRLLSSASPIAFDVHFENACVMNKPIDGGQSHGGIREDRVPFREWLVGGDQDGSALVSRAYELEQDAGLGLIFGHISDVVEDKQLEFVQLGDGAFEEEIAARLLQSLNQVRCAGVEHSIAFFDKRKADG